MRHILNIQANKNQILINQTKTRKLPTEISIAYGLLSYIQYALSPFPTATKSSFVIIAG